MMRVGFQWEALNVGIAPKMLHETFIMLFNFTHDSLAYNMGIYPLDLLGKHIVK